MKLIHRLQRLFIRWGVIKHPYGREYAKEHIGLFGGYRDPDDTDSNCET